MLTASEDGTLRLLHMAQDSPLQVQTADLPPDCKLMALSEPCNRLGVLHSATDEQIVISCLELGMLFGPSSASGEDKASSVCP